MSALLGSPFAVLVAYCAAVACLIPLVRMGRAGRGRHARAFARRVRRLGRHHGCTSDTAVSAGVGKAGGVATPGRGCILWTAPVGAPL